MVKAVKTPSGAFRVQYRIGKERYSVTRDSEKEAIRAALAHQAETTRKSKPSTMSVGDAIDGYIKSKSNILSPSTIRGYEIMRKAAYGDIAGVKLSKLTERDVQLQINQNAAKYSAKSIANQYGLLITALRPYNLSFSNVALKPKAKIHYNIPSPSDIAQIIKAIENTNIECWLLCAIMLGLRQSEIAGLKWENYSDGKMNISGAIVLGPNGVYIEKNTNKSAASTRTLDVPEYLSKKLDQLPRTQGHIFSSKSTTIFSRFRRLLEKNNLPHFSMHSLRHANASVMLLIGTPNKYAMERMGHSTDDMLKTVYQHTFQSEQDLISEKMNAYFNNLINPTDAPSDK